MNAMRRLIPILFLFLVAGCAHAPEQKSGITSQEIESRLGLAEMYLVEAEPRMALEQLRAVEGAAVGNPRLFFFLGVTYELLNDLELSARSYQRAVELDPSFGDAWNNLGQVRQARGEFDAARHAYRQALNLEEYMTPEFAAYNLASLYAQQGVLDQALAYSSLGIEKNRRYAPLYLQSAELLRMTGRHEEAVKVLRTGAAARPDNPQIKLVLAEELVRLGLEREAASWLERILEEDPESDEAATALHYLEVLR